MVSRNIGLVIYLSAVAVCRVFFLCVLFSVLNFTPCHAHLMVFYVVVGMCPRTHHTLIYCTYALFIIIDDSLSHSFIKDALIFGNY